MASNPYDGPKNGVAPAAPPVLDAYQVGSSGNPFDEAPGKAPYEPRPETSPYPEAHEPNYPPQANPYGPPPPQDVKYDDPPPQYGAPPPGYQSAYYEQPPYPPQYDQPPPYQPPYQQPQYQQPPGGNGYPGPGYGAQVTVYSTDGQVPPPAPPPEPDCDGETCCILFFAFLIPLVGWIYYCFASGTRPKLAKKALILSTVMFIIYFIMNLIVL